MIVNYYDDTTNLHFLFDFFHFLIVLIKRVYM